jgi:glycosyltransferase involved in cell wall biosynthesis
MKTRISVVIPVKNASRYVKQTIDSIAFQACKSLIDLEFLYAKSSDNTLEIIKFTCSKNRINFHIHFEEESYFVSLSKLVLGLKNPYFTFFCCSDEYICDNFLITACDLLSHDDEISFVHSDILGCGAVGSSRIRPGMAHRTLIKGEGAARFYANVSMLNEIMADLACVFKTKTILQLLQSYARSGSTQSNTFGEITIALLASGCIGEYIDRYSVIGHDHADSLTNDPNSRSNLSWGLMCNKLVGGLHDWISSSGFKWRDSNLAPLHCIRQKELRKEYFSQRDLISRIARRNSGFEESLYD